MTTSTHIKRNNKKTEVGEMIVFWRSYSLVTLSSSAAADTCNEGMEICNPFGFHGNPHTVYWTTENQLGIGYQRWNRSCPKASWNQIFLGRINKLFWKGFGLLRLTCSQHKLHTPHSCGGKPTAWGNIISQHLETPTAARIIFWVCIYKSYYIGKAFLLEEKKKNPFYN